MNSHKQILILGIIFISIVTTLFFNIRIEYKTKDKITRSEISGMKQIVNIHNLDILLKNIRGISQLKKTDAQFLKRSLYLTDENIFIAIKKLNDKKIEKFYNNIVVKKKTFSQMNLFIEYTNLLKLLYNKRIDVADKSHLLFENSREIYFLITMSIMDIPNIIENIGKIRGIGAAILNNNDNNEEKFLLKTNIHTFIDRVDKIRYTIDKLDFKDKNRLKELLDLIVTDFYNIKSITADINQGKSKLTPKEYFLETSKLVNKINNLFSTSSNLISTKLEQRYKIIETKQLVGTILYILLLIITLFVIYLNYTKSYKDKKHKEIKQSRTKFISILRDDYSKEQSLKQICDKSLNHIINYFKAINGSLYLFDEENEKLYLGATYGIKYDDLNHTLDLHENIISENILEKKIKINNIELNTSLGTIPIKCTKLVTIPIMEFENSIGTIQLTFDNSFLDVDIDFLQNIVSLMGTYIYKAQKDDEAKRYLKMIDKNVLISKTDLDGNIIEVSEQLCALSLYTKDELIGKNHRILKHNDMKKETFIELWDSITQGKIWRGEIKNSKKDGGYYWVDSIISPDFDLNGNIIGFTAIRNDITNKKTIEQIAITDGLTSLYNRRHFDNIFPEQISLVKRSNGLLVFVLIDIDHFKQYNDTYGHQEGDMALKLVAQSFKQTLKRPIDYIFRLGGEEFGLVYQINDIEDAYKIALKIKQNIENLKIAHAGNSASQYLTISSGLYLIKSDDNSTIDTIYKKADEALYRAKQNGRNQICLVD